jgi:hypothetical protein
VNFFFNGVTFDFRGSLGGGGGATYVYDVTNSRWLFVAGGGAGGGLLYTGGYYTVGDGLDTTSPGSGGGGSVTDATNGGGGGGGITGNGSGTTVAAGGNSYANGSASVYGYGGGGAGGYGGGGGGYCSEAVSTSSAAAGGGGGYTGGNGGSISLYQVGGTSYRIPDSTLVTDIVNSTSGNGSLNITMLGTIYADNDITAANNVTTTNLIANTLTMTNATSTINVTGNIYASNAVTTTNVFASRYTMSGNVTVTSDVSGSTYVTAKRAPTASLQVSNYIVGSVPLTTTTNLIQRYLSNTANVVTSGIGGYGPALGSAGTVSSWVQIPYQSAVTSTNNSNIFIEAWVYVSTIAGYSNPPIVISQGNGGDDWGLRINSGSSSLEFFVFNATPPAITNVYSSTFTTGAWRYIAASLDLTGLRLYTFTAPGTTSATVSGNGAGTTFSGTPRNVSTIPNLSILGRTSEYTNGYVYDLRIYKGGIVPRGSPISYTIASATPYVFGTTQPGYIGGTPRLHFSLQSQYFPGASTSPYGPCLTLPGTVGSYYSAVNSAYDVNWKTNGFCLEAWVNYASFANSNVTTGGQNPLMLGHMSGPGGSIVDWVLGATQFGTVQFWYWNSSAQTVTSSATITTGSWNHLMVQSNGTNLWLAINGTFVSGAGTAISGTPVVTAGVPIIMGQYNNNQGPNFAIAKARIVIGNDTSAGSRAAANVYSAGNFTPSPNLGAVPAGATVAWSLDSQYPLPTYPSIQDVTPLPSQLTLSLLKI